MTFDLFISGEKKKKKDKDKELEFIVKSSGRVCVHRISSEWKECSESRKAKHCGIQSVEVGVQS